MPESATRWKNVTAHVLMLSRRAVSVRDAIFDREAEMVRDVGALHRELDAALAIQPLCHVSRKAAIFSCTSLAAQQHHVLVRVLEAAQHRRHQLVTEREDCCMVKWLRR